MTADTLTDILDQDTFGGISGQYHFGHFSEDGTEFVITNPKTPRAFDNFLWNDSAFSCVQQTGVGYFDYQPGDKEAVQLLTGIGRICDFDVHGRDGLMSRIIYVRDNYSGEYWTLNWEPVRREYASYACTHGAGYTILESEVSGIKSTFRIFIPCGNDPVEIWTLNFENVSGRKRNLSIFTYNQFALKYKWGFDSYGDMIFRNSYFSQKLNAMIAVKHPHHRPHDVLTGFITSDVEVAGYDGSRDRFAGIYNTLAEPEAVLEGACRNSPGSSDSTVGVLQHNICLEDRCDSTINMILGASDGEDGIASLREKYINSADKHFQDLKAEKSGLIARNHLVSPDAHLNRMFNTWLKQETLYGATWCRWGWMGYRDLVQHGFGVCSLRPERTRSILLEALRHQYSYGLALRGWNPVDRKAYSDSALWLIFTLSAYLKETGDLGLLEEEVEFFDDGSDTVLGHITRALDFLEQHKGEHGICLIKFGDWNDSLTAVGQDGKGESIWLSMAYAEALRLMSEVFVHTGRDDLKTEYDKRYTAISKALNENAWDGKWYVRCYDDSGRPVGSDKNEQAKIFLNAQSWAMISGIADEERQKQVIASIDEMLLTDLGYLLLAPTFFHPDPNVGRISCLEPGICENGTVYSHGNVFAMLGMLRGGMPDKAYETFKRVTPGYMLSENDPKHNCPPYVYANGYYGPDHRNNPFQMEFTWVTGSVAWFYNVIMREMIGVKAEFDGLLIDPKLPSDWDNVSITRQIRGKTFEIEIVRTGESFCEINGAPVGKSFIAWDDCLAENRISVGIGR